MEQNLAKVVAEHFLVLILASFFLFCSCSSEVGRSGDKQYITLAPHCWNAGDVAHVVGTLIHDSLQRCLRMWFLGCSPWHGQGIGPWERICNVPRPCYMLFINTLSSTCECAQRSGLLHRKLNEFHLLPKSNPTTGCYLSFQRIR